MAEAMINLQHQSTIPSLSLPTAGPGGPSPHHHHHHPQQQQHQHQHHQQRYGHHPTSESSSNAVTTSTSRIPVHHMSRSVHPLPPPPAAAASNNHNSMAAPPPPMTTHPAMVRTPNTHHHHPSSTSNSATTNGTGILHPSSTSTASPSDAPQVTTTTTATTTVSSIMDKSRGSASVGGGTGTGLGGSISPRRNSKVMFDLPQSSSVSSATTTALPSHVPSHGTTPTHSLQSSSFHGGSSTSNSHKRHKSSTQVTAQNVIMGIQQGITGHERREAIHNACAAFDHGVEMAHDDEIKVGADAVLFKHLTFLLYKRSLITTRVNMMMLEQEEVTVMKGGSGSGSSVGSDKQREDTATAAKSIVDRRENVEKEKERNNATTSANSGTSNDEKDWNCDDINQAITRTRSTSAESEGSSYAHHHADNANNTVHNHTTTTNNATPTHHRQQQQQQYEQQYEQPTHITTIKSSQEEERESLMEEICTTLSGLEMVLRCSADCISTSFRRIGQELLYILICFMQEELDARKVTFVRNGDENENENEEPTPPLQQRGTLAEEEDYGRGDIQGGESGTGRRGRGEVVQQAHHATEEGRDENGTHGTSTSDSIDIDMDTMDNPAEMTKGGHKPSPAPSPSPIASPKRVSPTTTATNATSTGAFTSSSTSSYSASRTTGDAIFKTATKIIGHFARVGSLTNTLADVQGLLTTLQRVIAANKVANSSIHRTVPIEAKLNSLWVIANLACCAENMMKMAQHPHLLDTIVHVASHPNDQDESDCDNVTEYLQILRSRSIAIRAVLNLSWAHGNKIPFSEHAALVDALLRAASQRHSSWTGHGMGVSGYLLQTRRHAAGALRNLAAAPRRYKRRLCRFRDQHTFLETLANIATHDNDEVVRGKVHATLFNLVSADTAKLFVEKQAVLDVIVRAATSMEGEDGDGRGGSSHGSDVSKSMALQTLQSLEKAIPEDEDDYEVLRPVLSRFDSQVTMFKSISRPGLATCGGQTAV